MHILSIQSWVAYGHVGNAAAVFPLQRLGAEVSAIHTVQFSNHTGYGDWTGEVFPGETIGALVDGIARRGVLGSVDAVLSGYVGDPLTGDAILDTVARVRAANPRALYGLDPVFGDMGRGIFARPGVEAFFAERAVPEADLMTPNQFELEHLTGAPAPTLADAKTAIERLRTRMRAPGPRAVLVTSLQVDSSDARAVELLVGADGRFHHLRTPRLSVDVNGAGDMISALFLFHMLETGDPVLAMTRAASAVWGVIRRTEQTGTRELALIAAQDELLQPTELFRPERC